MKRLVLATTVLLFSLFLVFVVLNLFQRVYPVQAISDVDKIQQEIDELAHLKKLSEDATTPLESEVANLEARIRSAQIGINNAKQQAAQLALDIEYHPCMAQWLRYTVPCNQC